MSTPTSGTALRLTGADALDLLDRIGTQSLADLAPGQARATLFCDFRGRLLHRAIVARTSDEAVWLVRHDAPPEPLAAFVDRHVFREDVRIEDRPSGLPVRAAPGGVGLPVGAIRERDGVPVALQLEPAFGLVLGDAAAAGESESDRILAARPLHDHEIRDEFHPYEVGLAHEVHLNKGCYTGQEILLRLVTYGGVRRGLAQVRGMGAPPETPADVARGETVVGRLTSAAADGDGWIGLAVLRADAGDPAALAVVAHPLTAVKTIPATQPLGRP